MGELFAFLLPFENTDNMNVPISKKYVTSKLMVLANNNETLAVKLTQLQGSRAILPSKPYWDRDECRWFSQAAEPWKACPRSQWLTGAFHKTLLFQCWAPSSSQTCSSSRGNEGHGNVVTSPPHWLERARICSGCLTTFTQFYVLKADQCLQHNIWLLFIQIFNSKLNTC